MLLTSSGGPSARSDHTLTVDAKGTHAYLFGGRSSDGVSLADLWVLDLATAHWRLLRDDGPPARFGHNAAWVDGLGLVIFAGQGATFYNDLWAYDPAAARWRKLPDGGDLPVARYGSCAGIGPDGRLWISHGFTSEGTRFADTRAYDFDARRWADETPAGDRPIERCLHGCWWTSDGRLALFAGQTTGTPALGDLWHLTPGPRPGTNGWSQASLPERLRPRQLYAAARWGDSTIVFGGGALDGSYLSDAWQLPDGGDARRLRVGSGPTARAGAELVADPQRGRLLLFGGSGPEGANAELWSLGLPGG